MLRQWEATAYSWSGNSWFNVVYPIIFSKCFAVITGYESAGTGNFYGWIKQNTITTSGFTVRVDGVTHERVLWLAFGV